MGFFLTSKITHCSSSFSPCFPFNLSSCTTENVGRLVTPAKKLEDTIRLAELVIEVLQQNEEHHAEVSSVLSEVVSPQVFHRIRWELCIFVWCLPSWCWVTFFKSWKYTWVPWRQGALQEECVFKGEGGLKDELIELYSPWCQSAAFLTVPAWPKYSPPTTCKSKPVLFPERLYFQIMTCVCVPPWAGSLLQLLLLLSGGEQGKLQQNRTILLSAPCQVVSRGLCGPLQYVVSYWPVLPWLIGNTSITSHRG